MNMELLSRATSKSRMYFQPKLEEASRADQWEFRVGVIKDKEITQPSTLSCQTGIDLLSS
jgi:hypothetical protein